MLATTRIALAALALRAGMLLYGVWQDAHLDVKYTDVDYLIVTEAAAMFRDGGAAASPYDRTTYRYTPIYAWLAAYVPAPRLLFALADVVAGAILLAKPLSMPTLPVACAWLLNPYVANISTRGSTDSLTAVAVLLALAFTMHPASRAGAAACAGAALGTATHLRMYPAVFGIPLLVHHMNKARDARAEKNASRRTPAVLLAPPVVAFAAAAAAAFAGLAAAAAYMHGWWPFLYNTYLYHFTRSDHRHNFSVYSYALNVGRAEGVPRGLPLGAILVGVVALGTSPRFAYDPASAMFFQCFLFVAFNKVMTSQYAIWFLSLLPCVLPRLSRRRLPGSRRITLLTLWVVAQGVWLYFAYRLEFNAENTYRQLFCACAAFFGVNVYIICSLLHAYDGVTRASALNEKID